MSFLFSCLFLSRLLLLILLLLLMSGDVHPHPGPIFPCSVSAGNVTWWGRSLQCCTCSKWDHLRCSLLSVTKFKTLGSSHSWICPPCCVPASSGDNTMTSSLDSSSLYTFTVQSAPCANAAFPPNPRLQSSYPPSAQFVSSPSAHSPPPHAPGCLSTSPSFSSPPHSFMVLQWNAGGLRARSTELLHFISSHSVDPIFMHESNPDSSCFFQMPRTLAAVSSFVSNRAYLSLNFLSSLFLCLTSTLIM